MSHMDLRVEFLAGTDLYQAVEEAIEKAVKLDLCYVIFNFNGVEIHVGKNADYDQIKKEYEKGNVKFIVNNGG
jgi:hypothetical protein